MSDGDTVTRARLASGRSPQAGTTRPKRSADRTDRLLELQRTAGNQAVRSLLVQRDEQTPTPIAPPAQSEAEVLARQPAVAQAAKKAATAIWKKSHAEQHEYGGILYQDGRGKVSSTEARTSSEKTSVDVGQEQTNAGCPAGTMPVGYWHTHALELDPLTHEPRKKLDGDAAFSQADIDTGHDYQLAAFVQDKFAFHALSVGKWFDPSVYTQWRPHPGAPKP